MYDYGARNYDPALGRWMNIDPLASDYSSFTPYSYAINNPVYFLDPDGMRVRNGDEEKRKKAEKTNTEKQASLESKAAYLGISANASKKEWKKAALAKEGKTEWSRAERILNEAQGAKKDLDKWTERSSQTSEKLAEFQKEGGELYDKLDALDFDFYYMTSHVSELTGMNGLTSFSFDVSDKSNIKITSEFGVNSLVVFMKNVPESDYTGTAPTTLEVTQHESGHADYATEKAKEYYEWIKNNNINTRYHDGHSNNDPSGARATQFGPKNFKKVK